MTSPSFLQLLRSAEPAKRAAGARDFGRHLADTTDRDLRSLRRELHRAPESDATVQATLEAISNVARGFESTREADAEDVELLATIKTRKYWAAILAFAADEPKQPSAVADHLDIDPSQVTRTLGDLEDAGLVIRTGTSGRSLPFRLTPRGRRFAELVASAEEVRAPIRALVRGIVQCFAVLTTTRRSSRRELLELLSDALDPQVAAMALKAFTAELASSSLAIEDSDDSVIAPGIEIQSRLDLAVRDALQKNDQKLVDLLDGLSRDQPLVVRAAKTRDDWAVLIGSAGLTNVSVAHVDHAGGPVAVRGSYRVLYESVPLLKSDRTPAALQLQELATDVHVFTMPPTDAPGGVTPVHLPL